MGDYQICNQIRVETGRWVDIHIHNCVSTFERHFSFISVVDPTQSSVILARVTRDENARKCSKMLEYKQTDANDTSAYASFPLDLSRNRSYQPRIHTKKHRRRTSFFLVPLVTCFRTADNLLPRNLNSGL